jgi:cyclophilin family peptidyl-prolyl cis-trans isomerase
MADHKAPTQVTISTGEGNTELHDLVRRYWKPVAGVAAVIVGIVVWRVAVTEQKAKSDTKAWNRVRKDVQMEFSIQPPPLAVLGGLEEELAGSTVAPWVKAIGVGSQLEAGKTSEAVAAAKSIVASWPDNLLVATPIYAAQSEGSRMTLPAWIETSSAALSSFESERPDLKGNPPPAGSAPRVRIKTSKGDIVVALYDSIAPKHAENFLKLCDGGFYDGTKVSRLVAGQLVEAGDPNTRGEDSSEWGKGGPGYTLAHEGYGVWNYKYSMTSIPMDDNFTSNGSMFRLLLSDAHSFDGAASVFGVVVEGMEVLDALGVVEVQDDRPKEAITILATEVLKAG